jgi:EF-P beta-lysylation protein EpmB
LQVWPFPEETHEQEGFTKDCLSENALFHSEGIIDKYANRSLVISTSACAIHCRYCFRREFDYPTARDGLLDNLTSHLKRKEISELILSGGDPLVLRDKELFRIFEAIKEFEQIKTVRFHTRVPVVLPNRITDSFKQELISLLQTKQVVFVVHVNHAREISESVQKLLLELRSIGIHLLNQSVLLRNVNDSEDALAELSQRLFESGVLPYYLHQLDRVKGAHHFEVSESLGLRLMEQLRKRLPGYLVPRYVKEVVGAVSKSPIVEKSPQQEGIENGKI